MARRTPPALNNTYSDSDDDLDPELNLPEMSSAGGHWPFQGGPNRDHRAAAIRLRKMGPSYRGSAQTSGNHSDSTISDDSSPLLNTGAPQRAAPKPKQSLPSRAWSFLRRMVFSDTRYGSLNDISLGEEQDPQDLPGKDPAESRTIEVGRKKQSRSYASNSISNTKYTPWNFIPLTLYNEFSFFFNLYFLFVALSQIIPPLRIGYISTYIAPLAFVLAISIGKEAVDDIARRRRDAEANAEPFSVLSFDAEHFSTQPGKVPTVIKPASSINVGDVVKLEKNQRVPADIVVLKCTAPADQEYGAAESSGEAFIRTDQLDGETDWKLRLAAPIAQSLPLSSLFRLKVVAGRPERRVNHFNGIISLEVETTPVYSQDELVTAESAIPESSLDIDNTAWADTVVASSCTLYGVVVYTGPETRQALSSSPSRSKTGLLEYEINSLTKVLCFLTLFLSIVLVALQGTGSSSTDPDSKWYVSVMRYLILFSTIVPVSLRVNIDMAKSAYAWLIERDSTIPDTVVRTSTIPEDLGRIEYLLTDKTGTLTQNVMEMKKIHLGTVSYANDAMEVVKEYVDQFFVNSKREAGELVTPSMPSNALASKNPAGLAYSLTRPSRDISIRVKDLVLALAVCHNVTPTIETSDPDNVTYQASSPDEIAIVQWTEEMGLRLQSRDTTTIVLSSTKSRQEVCRVKILKVFPFTSENKRMGIIVQFLKTANPFEEELTESSEIWFYQKGADSVMVNIVKENDWLVEETQNMARDGLRTLVVGRRRITLADYEEFAREHKAASCLMEDRDAKMAQVVRNRIEKNLELLGVTGVEDKLQNEVKPSLELLRKAGIKVWMLTGDKVETAQCIATSSRMVYRGQYIHVISGLTPKDQAANSLNEVRGRTDAALLIDGDSLAVMLSQNRYDFISTAVNFPTVICCRCSPQQKADVAKLIRAHTKKRVACIGDGGNDVPMIRAADVGIGIVGKEGRQASLAADFSIMQFSYLKKLLVWHGRNSYKRSSNLALFVMHRGLIFAVCQTVYSISSSFEPIALFRDWLLVAYATIYTMVPVFSLILDRDVDEDTAELYPELYKELTSQGRRILGYKNFLIWVLVSVYQGAVIQGISQVLVGLSDDLFTRLVAVSFTALVLNELLMVGSAVTMWHWGIAVSILGTVCVYFGSVPFLAEYFDLQYVITISFWWRMAAVLGIAFLPPYFAQLVNRFVRPPSYRKVQDV